MALEYDGALATQRGQWIATDMLTGPLSIKQKANFETSLKYLAWHTEVWDRRVEREEKGRGRWKKRESEKDSISLDPAL